nr:MAG: hypothetical protein KatS3mg041_0930 [Bacteroidota bacterium]
MIRIRRIQIESCGPVRDLDWRPGSIELIYDRNEEGKTALVDAILHCLFPRPAQLFGEGTGRFPDVKAELEVLVRDRLLRLRADQGGHLLRALGWTQPRLGRLFVVRSGLLELAREEKDFQPLLEELLRHAMGPLATLSQVRARVIRDARLTPKLDWLDREEAPLKSRVRELLARLKTWEELIGRMPELEVAEREQEGLLRELQSARRERQEVLNRWQSLEAALRATRVRRAWELYRKYRLLLAQLQQQERYRREDVSRWAHLEAEWARWRTIEEEALQYREQEKRLAELESLWRIREAEWENRRIALQERERADRETLLELESRIRLWEEARRATQKRHQRVIWLGPVALFGIVGGGILAALGLGGSGPLLVGLGVGLLLLGVAGWGYWMRLRARLGALEEERRRWMLELERRGAPKGLEDPLRAWEAIREQLQEQWRALWDELEAEREQLRAQQERERARLAASEESLRRRLDEWIADPEELLARVRARREAVQAELERLRLQTGLADRERLEERVRQREQLELELRALTGRWEALTGVSIMEAEDWLARHPEPEAVDPLAEDPEQEQARLRAALREIESRVLTLEESLREAERRREAIALALREHRISSPAELYARWEEDRATLLDLIESRLAGIWAVQALERLEKDQQRRVDWLLHNGGEQAAVEIFRALNERYRDLRYDPRSRAFVAIREDGLAISEFQLSDGARKQLLLALRIAFLEQLLRGEAAFLVLDDPFITYDDEGRKERAVRWLGTMVDRGWQVLYLTTDRTTRELFEAHLGVRPLRIQELLRSHPSGAG